MSENIYNPKNIDFPKHQSTIKPYKIKKLFFAKSEFQKLYKRAFGDQLTRAQYEYKMCVHMWLLAFREEDIINVMAWWYKRHNLKVNWWVLKNEIIPNTYRFTIDTRRQRRRQEYQRSKGRKQEVATRRPQ